MNLCECGCGEPVAKEGNRFINGHNSRGATHFVSDKARKRMSEAQIGHPVSDITRANISKAQKGLPKPPRTLAHRLALSKAQKGIPKTPEAIAINIESHKEQGIRQLGGNDIVWHHTLYDHADLSLHRVTMTRSNHSRGHKLLQKLGIEIPHINAEGDNNV